MEKLLEIDEVELKQHGTTWKKRGELIKSLAKMQGKLRFEFDRIIGTSEEQEGP